MTADPRTPAEWQDAVDGAYGALALDAARQYGLVEGGPAVNADRCQELLERGAALGFEPAADAIEAFALSVRAEDEERERVEASGFPWPLRRMPPREGPSQR